MTPRAYGIVPSFSMEPAGDAVFLTDGRNTIRFRDLPKVMRVAEQHLLSSLQEPGPDRLGNPERPAWFGIDTTRRFEAVLWMTFFWFRKIPFVPFSLKNPEPASLFRPDVLVLTSPETEGNPLITELLSSGSGNPTIAAIHSKDLLQHLGSGTESNVSDPMLDGPLTDPDIPFCGIATSGSSDRPKRVVLLRGNMMAAARNAFRDWQRVPAAPNANRIEIVDSPGSPINDYLWGNCLPLDHTGGLAIVFRALLSGTGIFLWDRFDERTILSDLRTHPGIRRVSLVPTMLKRLLAFGSKHAHKPPDHLDQVLLGGGPAGGDLITEARSAGWLVCFSYGMTETCGQIAAQTWIDAPASSPHPPGAAGRPFPGHELSIRDAYGREVAPGGTGLLWIRGPQVFPGYLDDNRRILPSDSGPDRDGWFDTGDYARLDGQSNLFIEARRTDLIVSGGENVNPVEVEQILRKFPQVSDAAVIGMCDDEWGQMVVAFIVPNKTEVLSDSVDSTLDDGKWPAERTKLESSLVKLSAGNLKPHQRPKKYVFTTSIPRTALGKIERKKLQDKAKGLSGEK
jgi:acyl-CoA synthetase (AMP-forming)/AMP-acid ligase II